MHWQFGGAPLQAPVTATVTLPPLTTVASCAMPLQPVSSTPPFDVGRKVNCVGHALEEPFSVAIPPSCRRPAPGRPATLLTDDEPVGAMQNTDAKVGR